MWSKKKFGITHFQNGEPAAIHSREGIEGFLWEQLLLWSILSIYLSHQRKEVIFIIGASFE